MGDLWPLAIFVGSGDDGGMSLGARKPGNDHMCSSSRFQHSPLSRQQDGDVYLIIDRNSKFRGNANTASPRLGIEWSAWQTKYVGQVF